MVYTAKFGPTRESRTVWIPLLGSQRRLLQGGMFQSWNPQNRGLRTARCLPVSLCLFQLTLTWGFKGDEMVCQDWDELWFRPVTGQISVTAPPQLHMLQSSPHWDGLKESLWVMVRDTWDPEAKALMGVSAPIQRARMTCFSTKTKKRPCEHSMRGEPPISQEKRHQNETYPISSLHADLEPTELRSVTSAVGGASPPQQPSSVRQSSSCVACVSRLQGRIPQILPPIQYSQFYLYLGGICLINWPSDTQIWNSPEELRRGQKQMSQQVKLSNYPCFGFFFFF